MLGRDSSPLLSSLGIVALASAAASGCSGNKGGPAPLDDVADVIDVAEGLNDFYCECYGELYGYDSMDVQACLSELNISDEETACIANVFDGKPAEFEVLRCQAEAQRILLSCSRAEGCGESFTCDDGGKVPESYVCDGDTDCGDGSDEQQSCPAPFMCEDGMALEDYSVCDGFEDCAGGEDENACPDPFVCGDGRELPPEWVCDEAPDCEDGSDEQQSCPVTCTSGYFMQISACGEFSEEVQRETSWCFPFFCFDGAELPAGQQCDGTPDCTGGEDEDELFCNPSDPTGGSTGGSGESTGGDSGESTGG